MYVCMYVCVEMHFSSSVSMFLLYNMIVCCMYVRICVCMYVCMYVCGSEINNVDDFRF